MVKSKDAPFVQIKGVKKKRGLHDTATARQRNTHGILPHDEWERRKVRAGPCPSSSRESTRRFADQDPKKRLQRPFWGTGKIRLFHRQNPEHMNPIRSKSPRHPQRSHGCTLYHGASRRTHSPPAVLLLPNCTRRKHLRANAFRTFRLFTTHPKLLQNGGAGQYFIKTKVWKKGGAGHHESTVRYIVWAGRIRGGGRTGDLPGCRNRIAFEVEKGLAPLEDLFGTET